MRCCSVSYQEERSVAVACGLFQVGERLAAKRSAGDVERERHRQVVLYIHQKAQVGAENLSNPVLSCGIGGRRCLSTKQVCSSISHGDVLRFM